VRDPQWKAGVEHHFHETLRGMIQAASAAGVPMIVAVPAGELVITPPFKVANLFEPGTPEAEAFESHWQRATDPNLSVEQRLDACAACRQLDPRHAGANYIAGRLQYERGNVSEAGPLLVSARDNDVCPLRATSPIIESVHGLAEQYGIPRVDTERLLDRRDHEGRRIPDGIADPELFVDHVHPSIPGHQLIADAVFSEIARLGWFEVPAEAESRYQQLAAQHLDSLGEAYYERGNQRLRGLRRWASGRAGQIWTEDEEAAAPSTP
jgi:hypothetical protein